MSPRAIPLDEEAAGALAAILGDASSEIRGVVAEELRRLGRAFRKTHGPDALDAACLAAFATSFDGVAARIDALPVLHQVEEA